MDARNTTMSLTDLARVLDWAAAEGWNPGLDDAGPFHAADPAGFFLRRIDGSPVSAVSVVTHGPGFAFLGLYLCRPEWRGQGHGLAVWDHALRHAGARSIGLDGVPEQQDAYRKSGFVAVGRTLRFEGTGRPEARDAVRAAVPADLGEIARLDRAATGIDRPAFLAAWTRLSATRQTLVLERDGAVAGFVTWRTCRDGTKIGPVIAPDTGAALGLIGAVGRLVPGGRLIVDLPEANTALARELEGLGYAVPFVTARMYRGAAPEATGAQQAIATMELG